MTRRIADDELLAELRRLEGELGCVPTSSDMTERGEYGVNTYSRRFGSWTAAVEAAGLEPTQKRNISDDELLSEIDRLAEELGDVPTADEMNKQGKYSDVVYRDRFGSWNEALQETGHDPNITLNNTEEELLTELRRVRKEVEQTPRKKDMDDRGEFNSGTYIKRFGSWNDALREVGCRPNQRDKITRDELIEEVKRVASELEESPTKEEFSEHAKFSVGPYNDRFEGWDRALEAAGLKPNRHDNVTRDELIKEIERLHEETGETPTVSMLKERGRHSVYSFYNLFESWDAALEECGFTSETGGIEYSKEELLNELRRLADELDRTPTTVQMTRLGEYGTGAYQRNFGSWNDALREVGLELNVRSDIPRDSLLEELRHLFNRLGRSPTREEVAEMSKYSAEPYKREFGSWNDALRAAELPVLKRAKIPDKDLLDELRRVADQVGGTPTQAQMEKYAEYYPSVYPKRFGTWNDAVEKAGLEPVQKQEFDRTELVAELEAVIDRLEHPPTMEEMREHGDISEGPYRRVFGSWNDAIRAVGYEPRHPRDAEEEYTYYGPNWQRQREKRIAIDGYQCRKCGMGRADHQTEYGQDLSVHHIERFRSHDTYKSANTLTNLITVCRVCHREVEGKPKSFFLDLRPEDTRTDSGHYTLDMFE